MGGAAGLIIPKAGGTCGKSRVADARFLRFEHVRALSAGKKDNFPASSAQIRVYFTQKLTTASAVLIAARSIAWGGCFERERQIKTCVLRRDHAHCVTFYYVTHTT
jgi:hypothetical protein